MNGSEKSPPTKQVVNTFREKLNRMNPVAKYKKYGTISTSENENEQEVPIVAARWRAKANPPAFIPNISKLHSNVSLFIPQKFKCSSAANSMGSGNKRAGKSQWEEERPLLPSIDVLLVLFSLLPFFFFSCF